MEPLTLDELLKGIQSNDPQVRTDAWLAAGTIGATAIKPLARMVAENEAEVIRLGKEGKTKELAQPLEVARAAKRALWKIVRTVGAPGEEAARAEVEKELIGLIGPDQPACVRREVLWMLSEIGTVTTIDALRRVPDVLDNKEIREHARCCVERIPGQVAVDALLDALDAAPDDFKLALAQSLRVRGVNVDRQRYPCKKLVPTKQTAFKPPSQ